MKKKIVLILGASGFLGEYVFNQFDQSKFNVLKQSRKFKKKFFKINLHNKIETEKKLQKIKPNFILNLASLTDINKCENNYKLAYNSNVTIIKNIQNYIKNNKKCHLLHVSTDQVYSGRGPHKEKKKVKPVNCYSLTKYLGEQEAMKVNATILRTNFVGKNLSTKKSLTDWFIDSCKAKKKILLFKDVFFSPLDVNTLSKIIIQIIKKRKPGIYNLGSKNGISKARFLRRLAKKLNLNTQNLKDINLNKVKKIVQRPKDMRLNVDLFEKTFKIKLPKINKVINKIYFSYL
jgi:dTDP-4-dehydrorhamnose reductase